MKTLIYLLLLLGCFGCVTPRQTAAVKPFIVTDKAYVYSEKRLAEYRFVDATGREFMLYLDSKMYEIGDTIK